MKFNIQEWYIGIEKYLNDKYQYIANVVKKTKDNIASLHQRLIINNYYQAIGFEVISVFLTGFLITIAVAPFVGWKPWFFVSYGLIPFLVVQFLVYTKSRWNKTK